MQRTGATQLDGRPILHKKCAFWKTTTLQERLDEQKLPHPYNTECLKNIYLRLKKKKKSEQPILPTFLQYLQGSTDHQSRQGAEQSER